ISAKKTSKTSSHSLPVVLSNQGHREAQKNTNDEERRGYLSAIAGAASVAWFDPVRAAELCPRRDARCSCARMGVAAGFESSLYPALLLCVEATRQTTSGR